MQISDGREKIESETKAFSTVSVSATENSEAFEITQHMFNGNTACGQGVVLLFLFGRERMMLAFLVRCLAVGVEFVYALIAAVGQQFHSRGQSQTAAFEEGKVVHFACTCRHA